MKKYPNTNFFIALITLIIFSYFVLQPLVRRNLNFFWTDNYYTAIYFFLISAFIFILFKKFEKVKQFIPSLKHIYYFVFLPLALFPILKCYFKVPYIFCRVCPKKCPWGELRPLIIPAFLMQNIDNRFWCFKLCPYGTLQELQCKVVKKRFTLPKILKNLRYITLLFTLIIKQK